jgi:glucose 1-dehydrogenase
MRVLITGGSRGIGEGICKRIAENAAKDGQRASIAICGLLDDDELATVSKSVEALGATVLSLHGDLGQNDVPGRLVEQAAGEFGGLDAVVANAGIADPYALKDMSVSDWDRMFNVNLRGPWLLSKASHPYLKESRGSFVVVSSMSAHQPHAGSGAYSPAKAGLTMLAQTLALEWAPDGIRVNSVSPGMTRTPMSEAMYADPEIKVAREKLIPLGRIGKADDIANAVAFFISPAADYITGEDLCVDGGFIKSIMSHIPGRPTSR